MAPIIVVTAHGEKTSEPRTYKMGKSWFILGVRRGFLHIVIWELNEPQRKEPTLPQPPYHKLIVMWVWLLDFNLSPLWNSFTKPLKTQAPSFYPSISSPRRLLSVSGHRRAASPSGITTKKGRTNHQKGHFLSKCFPRSSTHWILPESHWPELDLTLGSTPHYDDVWGEGEGF